MIERIGMSVQDPDKLPPIALAAIPDASGTERRGTTWKIPTG
jgi:hypothetical protein